ncbi:hypothetical protein PUN28_010696 [Cardiocondyla obscurior]|uniref:Ribosomal protein S14 n=1 Tax=Cardiocondyla obscurior TaxID=286306 RepID=A0AAW2FLS8_9HYME
MCSRRLFHLALRGVAFRYRIDSRPSETNLGLSQIDRIAVRTINRAPPKRITSMRQYRDFISDKTSAAQRKNFPAPLWNFARARPTCRRLFPNSRGALRVAPNSHICAKLHRIASPARTGNYRDYRRAVNKVGSDRCVSMRPLDSRGLCNRFDAITRQTLELSLTTR